MLPGSSAPMASRSRQHLPGDAAFRSVEIEKPLAHSVGYELLDRLGWNTYPGGCAGLSFGDQRARDIVAIARAVLDRVGRRHRVAAAIKHQAGEQARLVSSSAGVALGGVARERRLNRVPQRLIDDRGVLAGIGF